MCVCEIETDSLEKINKAQKSGKDVINEDTLPPSKYLLSSTSKESHALLESTTYDTCIFHKIQSSFKISRNLSA